MTVVGLGGLLLAIWLLLWGAVTPANVLSDVVVIALVLRFIPDARFRFRRPTVRVGPALRFTALVVVDLFRANLVVTREILSRQSSINTGVVAVPLPLCSDGLLTLVANVLSLTPGTLPIEVTREPPVIYVHVLHLRDVEAVRTDVQRLSALAIRAFGSAEAIALLDHPDWTRPTEVTGRLVDAGPAAAPPPGRPGGDHGPAREDRP